MLGEAISSPEETSEAVRKRPADESPILDPKVPKQHHKSTPHGASAQGEEQTQGIIPWPRTGETVCQKEVYFQVGKYLLEHFSIPGFRSHATLGLVDRDRIQFYHANHSVILVSSAINFGKDDTTDGLDKMIAIVIGFSRLSLLDNGILHNLLGGRLLPENDKLVTSKFNPRVVAKIQEGKKVLELEDENNRRFTLTFGDTISREPSLVGRSTTVLHATSPQCLGVDMVVKISWPGSGRTSEIDFLKKAIAAAEGTTDKCALNHLPNLLLGQDIVFGPDSTTGKVASLFENADFASGGYVYERRTLRIMVQEQLYPLLTLTDAKDIAQVLLDVICSTHFCSHPRYRALTLV